VKIETMTSEPAPLQGFSAVVAAVNLPADATGGRLTELGAAVTKVEPPEGDPVAAASADLYRRLTEGQTIVALDLKQDEGRARLGGLLEEADLLLTSSRPSALAKLGLAWPDLERRYPRLTQVAIVGHAAPDQEVAGHDLTYAAGHGLLAPPFMPRTLVADLGGAERAVTAAVSLLLGRERGLPVRYTEVALADSAAFFAMTAEHEITTGAGPLAGGLPYYRLYEAADGWVALAALEGHFQRRLLAELELDEPSVEAFSDAFRERPAEEWQRWAEERDIPLAAVR
jgi:crotonobetainyl-CoA:carnitine CoA-transferase CaiB-like acyl-CoA transferase